MTAFPSTSQRIIHETSILCWGPIGPVGDSHSLSGVATRALPARSKRVYGSADDSTRVGQMQESLRQSLIDQVKNSTQLKAYKDEGYNFAYTYHSASRPQLVLYSLKVTAADYQ